LVGPCVVRPRLIAQEPLSSGRLTADFRNATPWPPTDRRADKVVTLIALQGAVDYAFEGGSGLQKQAAPACHFASRGKLLMPAHIVAIVRIEDADKFAAYGRNIAGLSEKFGGVPVTRGPVSAFLEGSGPAGERVVVTRFADGAAARAYIESEQYQSAKALRSGAAQVVMRLIEDPA